MTTEQMESLSTPTLRNLVYGYRVRLSGVRRRKEGPAAEARVSDLLARGEAVLASRDGIPTAIPANRIPLDHFGED